MTAMFAAMVLLFGIVIGTARSGAAAQDAGTPSASPDASPAAGEAAFTYVIDMEQSSASYEVMEELADVGENQVIGTTNQMQGNLLFDDQMNPIPGSRVDVDMRFLATDSTRRDNYLYENVLETGEFPLATFIVTGTQGLEGPLTDGQEVSFQLVGDLTIHGVTNEATWDVTATLSGDTITGTATTSITLDQYDMEKPIVGPVVSIEDTIDLQMDIVAVAAA
jgi:polyisoprenoid-binding protein YceI